MGKVKPKKAASTALAESTVEDPKFFQIRDECYIKVKYHNKRTEIHKIKSQTIKDQYGLNKSDIPYYEGECYYPSHTEYKPIVDNCINLYHPLPIEPIKGEWRTWEKLLRHVGREKYEILLDYLIVLLRYPLEKLPVIVLVSSENNTGKSTLMWAVTCLLGDNAGFYGQEDLNNTFNDWAMNTLVAFEELSDIAKSMNRIKAVSTAKKITINRKFLPLFSFEPFCKIMIASNNEEKCLKLSKEDTRYLVLKVPTIETFDPLFDEKIKEEAPAMLHYLLNNPPTIKKQSRMWFPLDSLRTDQLEKIIKASMSSLYQDIEIAVDAIMVENELSELYITVGELAARVSKQYKASEISSCLRREFNMESKLKRYTPYSDMLEKVGKVYHFTCISD